MLRRTLPPQNVSDQESHHLAEPAALATIVLSGFLILYGLANLGTDASPVTLLLGGVGIFYAIVLFYFIMPVPARLRRWKWGILAVNMLVTCIGLLLIPNNLGNIPFSILILIAAITVIFFDRRTAYVFLVILAGIHAFTVKWPPSQYLAFTINHLALILLSFIVVETIARLGEANYNRIQRLETLNTFAQRISQSVERDELFFLIGEALRNAIKADTYFLGTMEGPTLTLHMLYDDNRLYPSTQVEVDGTLSGWVLRHERSLFIPDLRNEVDLEGVKLVIVGQEKTNLSWMGVPMRTKHVKGVMCVASYQPNDFDRTDLDLLENLAQHAALALDNAYHHSEVEAQSRLDSLTSVYNHGYIVSILRSAAEKSLADGAPLSLIMLDIDYFKQYNDNYGHQVGDQVLILLTEAIRKYIHATDSVGRWGGEEFTIVLPATNGQQAHQVAERIRETMNKVFTKDLEGHTLPVPTVSQGIAEFPKETEEVGQLIDLADQRLYVAKDRGRNQIEPDIEHWKK